MGALSALKLPVLPDFVMEPQYWCPHGPGQGCGGVEPADGVGWDTWECHWERFKRAERLGSAKFI